MKKYLIFIALFTFVRSVFAQDVIVSGPDGKLKVTVFLKSGSPYYNVVYQDKQLLEDSPLGLIADIGDFSKNMTYVGKKDTEIDKSYVQDRIKTSKIHYQANETICTFNNEKGQSIDITFRVSNNDIAFRYTMPEYGETACCVVQKEVSGFDFPQHTTTFITPQSDPMIGWKRTKPSYEEVYKPDEPIGTPSKYGRGYTFPTLFHVGNDGWVLVGETSVSSLYCGSRLSDGTAEGLYSIAYPMQEENNGNGTANPGLALPGSTPWRTITVGDDLKPIVETTIPFDVVDPLYAPSQEYKFGRSTWSWIMWQDNSVNYDDQIKYIDLSAAMGYEYVLIDGLWDKQIGYDKMEDLFRYAKSKGVAPFVWYNSNGYWNNAPQGAKQKMSTSIARKKEMKWLKEMGVKGLKVDFFGGDKQMTMQLYEDILSDANEYGLMIIFHGCTMPRGWERMYPNYVGSEAVLASENLIFMQEACDAEAFNATLHPFVRNSLGSMEFGPVLLNKRLNRTNDGGQIRKTTDVFQLATAVLFQNPVQMFAIAPNNLTDVPAFEIDYMKNIPTTWDEIQYIDGYPGKYCVIARRHGFTWYVVGVNAQKEVLKMNIELPMLQDKAVKVYYDKKDRTPSLKDMTIKKDGKVTIEIQPEGGIILVTQ